MSKIVPISAVPVFKLTVFNNYVPSRTTQGADPIKLFLIFLGLSGFAITEPLLTIFGANPAQFHFYHVDSPLFIVLYALAVVLLPALICGLLVASSSLVSRRLTTITTYAIVALLGGLWFLQVAKWSFELDNAVLLLGVALLGGTGVLVAYARWAWVKVWFQIAAIAPLVSVAVFLFSSDTGSLIRSTDAQIANSGAGNTNPSVLFIMLDEFPTVALFDPENAVDKVRYPNFSELAEQATWYRHYSVLADLTLYSVPSILTGKDPVRLGANNNNFPDTLFSLLAPTHHLTVFETVTRLCGLSQCSEGKPGVSVERPAPQLALILLKTLTLWTQRISLTERAGVQFDDFKEQIVTNKLSAKNVFWEAVARRMNPALEVGYAKSKLKRLEKFIQTFEAEGQPTLYFLHIEMPHVPWRFYGDGQLYDLSRNGLSFSSESSNEGEWVAKVSEYRFALQAQYTDQLLGEVFSRLKSLALWDELLIIVTADHGRSFKPNLDARVLRPGTLGDIAYAPLFIKAPHQQQGRIDDSNLMAYDLLPTIADILNVEIPWELTGFPAGHAGIAARGDRKVYFPVVEGRTGVMPQLGGMHTFSDKRHFPAYSSRAIGAMPSSGDPLLLLNGELALDNYFGMTPEDFVVRPGGRASVDELAALQNQSLNRAPLGIVMGNLEFEPLGDKVLIAINGQFVTGSPLLEYKEVANTFIAMLPAGVLNSQNDIGVFLVEGDQLLELEVH